MRRLTCSAVVLVFFASAAFAQEKHATPAPKYKIHFDHDRLHHYEDEQKKHPSPVGAKVLKAVKDHQSEFDLSKADDKMVFDEAVAHGLVTEMEQVKGLGNPMAVVYDLALWSVVVFVLLLLILRKMAWGPMLEGLKKREDSIRSAVEEAKVARAETERISTEFKAKMDQAYAEIPKMMEEARRDAQVMAEEMKAKATADIQTERQRLRREIETSKDQALKELQDHAANLATLISTKALKRAVSADDHRRLVDEALNDLQEAGKEWHP